ncbi:hypothetical protein KUTeg_016801 [Tegillarca granosa]|uniref:Carboxypeptidase Q n=1 Tax=Tegillarca granosa TaxID=220873 RepID=A0ABQ9EPI4_TEGGR|nr:hypothetical protein KUTeg_016801 [Tegillarca granosa]
MKIHRTMLFQRTRLFIVLTQFCFVAGRHSIVNGTLSRKLQEEISSYQSIADQIIKLSVNGAAQNQSYNRLATFVDKFGSRLAGTQNLENAIDYMLDVLARDGLENVHGESVKVPHWVRGSESAVMLEPRIKPLSILGLGYSNGTPTKGIKAEVLVVESFDELHKRASEAKGKIVVYNQKYVSYGVSVEYRSSGATEAAKVGGVASLIRSITPFSINSPHTGMQSYGNGVKKIPTACITVEDAEMMKRMADRGEKIVILLKMEAKNLPDVESRNTVAEIVGHQCPEQTLNRVVLVSGHLDSWDVGQGAMDDGGGAFISWQKTNALSLIKQLGLRPRRTLRLEQGGVGSSQYYGRHKKDIDNFDLVMESDEGTFTPYGIYFSGSKSATSIMTSVTKLLKSINATVLKPKADGEDIDLWMQHGDTMTVQDPHQMNLCAAVWAVVAYTVADLEEMLPRK